MSGRKLSEFPVTIRFFAAFGRVRPSAPLFPDEKQIVSGSG
jgi:hypothetical protein